jgi:CheY-like chemotaxis protein
VQTKYILYAEDDIDDQELLTEVLQEVDGGLRLMCVNDGYDVLHFLDNIQPGSSLPCIIILDINMPSLDGMQTLKLLKAHPSYEKIPVIMFSTSNSQKDIVKANDLGADDFITKPVQPDKLGEIAARFASLCSIVPERTN